MRLLILYTELAGYVLGNINRFLRSNPSAGVLLIHYPVNPEAPFQLNFPEGSRAMIYDRNNEQELMMRIQEFNPDIVLCSGWGNSFYLNAVKRLDKNVKKVICFDNPWKGNFRQWVNVFLSRFFILRIFKYAWVPGAPQQAYARKLGFREFRIKTGLYPADSELFSNIGREKIGKKGPYPKVMLCVARYISQKNLPFLWKAFIKANERTGNQWKLNCIGFGELFDQRIQHPSIQHLGFKQPDEMGEFILNAGVFVLPSTEEPWGVVVHEMALSALPLLLSDRVGSASMFLKDDNGKKFDPERSEDLEKILFDFMNLTDNELRVMAERSYTYGMRLQSSDWSETILKISNGN